MKVKILVIVILYFLIIMNHINVKAISPQILTDIIYSEGSNNDEQSYNNNEKKEIKFSIIGALKYRLFEKITRDIWDYLLLTTFIVGLLIVIVLQNTRYYIIIAPPKKEVIKLEENDLELIEKIKHKKSTNKNNNKKTNSKKKDM